MNVIIAVYKRELDRQGLCFWRMPYAGKQCIAPFTLQCNYELPGGGQGGNAQWEIREADGNWLVRGDEAEVKRIFAELELMTARQLMVEP